MKTFATLVWECPDGADHEATHAVVLTALTTAGITMHDAPLGKRTTSPDSSALVFRYITGTQLDDAIGNLKALRISFFLTTSEVGSDNDCSRDVNRAPMQRVTG